VVFDAWPIVEFYEGNDPATSAVEELLDSDTVAVISSVNLAELYTTIAVNIEDFARAMSFIRELREGFAIVPPTAEIAELAALIKHCFHLSLGDSFAAATSIAYSDGIWLVRPHERLEKEPDSYRVVDRGLRADMRGPDLAGA